MPKELQRLSANNAQLRVIGSGAAFPFSFSSVGGTKAVSIAKGVDKINQSIHMILSTKKGERWMLTEFGSNLHKLLFEPNDDVLLPQLRIETEEALRRWEKRIEIVSISFGASPDIPTDQLMFLSDSQKKRINSDRDSSVVHIRIDYVIKRTSVPGSYVYPFYRDPMPMDIAIAPGASAFLRTAV